MNKVDKIYRRLGYIRRSSANDTNRESLECTFSFGGAAQTVTGSMHMVHVNGQQLLLDCGLYQGKRKEAFERNREFPLDASQVDAVILSHAHIDHSGNLPTLVKNGYRKFDLFNSRNSRSRSTPVNGLRAYSGAGHQVRQQEEKEKRAERV